MRAACRARRKTDRRQLLSDFFDDASFEDDPLDAPFSSDLPPSDLPLSDLSPDSDFSPPDDGLLDGGNPGGKFLRIAYQRRPRIYQHRHLDAARTLRQPPQHPPLQLGKFQKFIHTALDCRGITERELRDGPLADRPP